MHLSIFICGNQNNTIYSLEFIRKSAYFANTCGCMTIELMLSAFNAIEASWTVFEGQLVVDTVMTGKYNKWLDGCMG